MTSTQPPDPSRRWLVLAVLVLVRTAIGFQFQSVAAIGPLLVDEWAIDYALLGSLIGLYMLPGIVFALPGGVLAQRFGDERIAALGLLAMTLGGAWLGFADDFTWALAGRIVSGIGAVILNVLLTKMVADWFAGREMAFAMALIMTSWPVGLGIALVTLGPVASAGGSGVALGLTAVVSAAALALTLAFYTPPAGLPTRQGSFRIALSRREWLLVSLSGLIWMFYGAGFILVISFGPSLMAEQGYSLAQGGFVTSLTTWAITLALPLGGYLAERLDRPLATMAGCFLASSAAIAAIPLGAAPVATFVVVGLLFGPPGGLIMKLPTSVLEPKNRSVGIGIYFSIYYAGMAALPALAGYLVERAASASAAFFFAGAIMFACAAILTLFVAVESRPIRGEPPG